MFRKQLNEFKLLINNIPCLVILLLVVSVVCMNLMANKTIINMKYLAIDSGILFAWLPFLCMDIITIYFGAKASTSVSILAILINLGCCLIFKISSLIPTVDDYSIYNMIFGGSWFVLLGSTIAMLCSSIINNVINHLIKKLAVSCNDKVQYMLRTYISTFIAQFFDNLIFAILVFMVFAPRYWDGFSWFLIQCILCSVTGSLFELIFQVIFSPIGYKVIKKWKQENIGMEYFNFVKGE